MGKGRIFRIICGIMIAVIIIILIVLFVSDDSNQEIVDIDMNMPYADTTNWMQYLSDDEYLSEITIPGTHDSCAQNVTLGYVMRCQNTDISQQLNNGYRYLDLRIAMDETDTGNRLKLVHNFANCHESGNLFSGYLYFDKVCADIYSFLAKEPTETVIVNIKIEDDSHSVSDISKLVTEEIRNNKDYWYTEDAIPLLGEVRGKVVLMTRYQDNTGVQLTGINLNWAEQNNTTPIDIPYELYVYDNYRLWVQDRYKYSVEDKYEAVIDGLENCEADENTLFFNFVSTSGAGKIGHPQGYAKNLNQLFMDYDLKDNTSYGVIILDFGDENLARHIYYTNLF